MKTDLHPDYTLLTVKLADGTEFVTRSTMDRERLNSEVDSSNHPFYTGKRTMVDTAGRVEKFRQRYGDAQAKQIASDEAEQAEADKVAAEAEGAEA